MNITPTGKMAAAADVFQFLAKKSVSNKKRTFHACLPTLVLYVCNSPGDLLNPEGYYSYISLVAGTRALAGERDVIVHIHFTASQDLQEGELPGSPSDNTKNFSVFN